MYLFFLSILAFSCNQDSLLNSTQTVIKSNEREARDLGDIANVRTLNVCDDPPKSSLYLYSFGCTSYAISPKLDGSSGTQIISATGLSCFPLSGHSCDNGPWVTGACVFTLDPNLSCTPSYNVHLVIEDLTYTVSPILPITSSCIGSYFTFEINCEDEIQSIRFCDGECFTQMCPYPTCYTIDINN